MMMKRNILYITYSLAAALLFSACEEVIVLDLKDSEPRTVIEASLNATAGELTVLAKKSIGFYDTADFQRITGARVELITEGSAISLSETAPGRYFVANLTVKPGASYRVSLTVSDEEVYQAQTVAPYQVRLDSLKVVRGFGDPRPTAPPVYVLNPIWKDPAGIANFYRFRTSINGEFSTGSFSITSDEQFDGLEVNQPLYRWGLEMGDTVSFEFRTIDSLSYRYFNQINDMARPSFVSATPYNPVGNFDNYALGYFGIFYSEVFDLIVRPR